MTLILLEVLGALGIAIFIVWWTMFSGRKPESSDAETPLPRDAEGPGRQGSEVGGAGKGRGQADGD